MKRVSVRVRGVAYRRSLTGAWIETEMLAERDKLARRRSLTGAWIETFVRSIPDIILMSLPYGGVD